MTRQVNGVGVRPARRRGWDSNPRESSAWTHNRERPGYSWSGRRPRASEKVEAKVQLPKLGKQIVEVMAGSPKTWAGSPRHGTCSSRHSPYASGCSAPVTWTPRAARSTA